MITKRREIHGKSGDYVLHQYGDEWEVYNMEGHFICYVDAGHNDTDDLLDDKIGSALRCAKTMR